MELNTLREQIRRLERPTLETLRNEHARCERNAAYMRLALIALTGIVMVVAVSAIVMYLWVTILQVDGTSMDPLLQMDEVILAVSKDNPVRGEVIAFYHNNKMYAKRVIAVSGDMVEINGDGAVKVNGTVLREPYVTQPSLGNCDLEFPYQVPPDTVFVLGDNRPASLDSRDSRFGPVPREQIVGKVVFKIWPLHGGSKL